MPAYAHHGTLLYGRSAGNLSNSVRVRSRGAKRRNISAFMVKPDLNLPLISSHADLATERGNHLVHGWALQHNDLPDPQPKWKRVVLLLWVLGGSSDLLK